MGILTSINDDDQKRQLPIVIYRADGDREVVGIGEVNKDGGLSGTLVSSGITSVVRNMPNGHFELSLISIPGFPASLNSDVDGKKVDTAAKEGVAAVEPGVDVEASDALSVSVIRNSTWMRATEIVEDLFKGYTPTEEDKKPSGFGSPQSRFGMIRELSDWLLGQEPSNIHRMR